MTVRTQLKWPIPCSVWEHHERRTIDRYGTKRLYAGIEAEQIAQLWLTFEETDATPRAGHTGTALKETKKESTTPLADQEKIEVHRDFHRETKERLSVHAKRYDVNKGVLLGYIIREYYEMDGWGYGIDAAQANDRGVPDDEEEEIPYHESDKIEWIAERIEPDDDGSIHGNQIRELVGEAGAASRTAYYQQAVLDHLNYVHHPTTHGVFIPQGQRWEEFGLQEDDLAIERKPYEALTRGEKIDGIKAVLQRTRDSFSVNGIHSGLFDGKGSVTHMRNLAQEVANANGFTSGGTLGGTTVIRATGSGSDTDASENTQTTLADTDSEADSDGSEAEPTDEDDDSNKKESLTAINQPLPIDVEVTPIPVDFVW